MRRLIIALAGACCLIGADAPRPWMDTSLSAHQRASLLLERLTLQQKVALMHGADTDVYSGYVPGNAELAIPALTLNDGPAGMRIGPSTALPAPLALAASWDRTLATEYGEVLGRDTRAKGADVILGPMVNIVRASQAGRTFESFGEDPYLASQMVAPEIRAIQAQHVIATIKHFALNNQENGRLRDRSIVDDRTLHEIYLPAFRASASAGVGAAMCAYNRIDADWACENHRMLSMLDGELGFDGFIMSDWGAQHSTVAAANAGLDMEMPDDEFYGNALLKAVHDGSVSEKNIDEHASRILSAMFAAGLFEHPPKSEPFPVQRDAVAAREVAEQSAVLLKNSGSLLPLGASRVHSIAIIGGSADLETSLNGGSAWVHASTGKSPLDAIRRFVGTRATVRFAYAQGVPFLDPSPTVDSLTLAPDAQRSTHGLHAEYFDNDRLSGKPIVTRTDERLDFNWQFDPPLREIPGAYSVRWTATFTPPSDGRYSFGLEHRSGVRFVFDGTTVADRPKMSYDISTSAFTRALKGGHPYPVVVEMRHPKDAGYDVIRLLWQPPAGTRTPDIERAVDLARRSNVAIVFAGEFRTEQYDRPTIALTGMQEELIRAVAHANPRTIVVLNTGGPVAIGSWANDVPAIVNMWYPGEESGAAVADVLFGNANPSGKLPVTFPASPQQIVAPVRWGATPYEGAPRAVQYREGLRVGYRWYDANHLAPAFPFGFGLSYTTFRLANVRIAGSSDGSKTVRVDVENTGRKRGAEVVQLYVGYPSAAGEPPKVLRGFQKIWLQPGEKKVAAFTLQPDAFAVWDTQANSWKSVRGDYTIWIGTSSRDLPMRATLAINERLERSAQSQRHP